MQTSSHAGATSHVPGRGPHATRAVRPTKATYLRRRVTVLLTAVTVISAPWLAQTSPTAQAADPVRVPAAAASPTSTPVRIVAAGTKPTGPMPAMVLARYISADTLIANPRLTLSDRAKSDLESGVMDQRVLAVIAKALETHSVEVTTLTTGHTRFVKGTNRVSNHVSGRAADIASVDGQDVSSSSTATRQLMEELMVYPEAFRPTEVGGPWDLDGPEGVGFTDSGHKTHIHVGFDA